MTFVSVHPLESSACVTSTVLDRGILQFYCDRNLTFGTDNARQAADRLDNSVTRSNESVDPLHFDLERQVVLGGTRPRTV